MMAGYGNHYAVVALITFLVSEISGSLSISKDSIQVLPGETRIVICRDKYGQPVFWKGPKGSVLGEDSHPKVEDRTFGKVLVFNGTKIDDTGEYMCYTKDRRQKKIFTLTVEEVDTIPTKPTKPYKTYRTRPTNRHRKTTTTEEPIEIQCPAEVVANEFEDATMECKVKNGKKYSVTWVSGNSNELKDPGKYQYLRSGEVLIVKNVSKDDNREVFISTIINDFDGTQHHRNITLIVYHKPYHYMSDTEVYVEEGREFNISCEVESNPPPYFKWTKDGAKFPHFERTSEFSTLVSLEMNEDTEGEYRCTAWNARGSTEKIFNLHLGHIPDPPYGINVAGNDSKTLTLNVTLPESEVDPMLIALIIEYKKHGEESWTVEEYPLNDTVIIPLTKLDKGQVYEFRAATKNMVGISEYTNSTIFEISFAVSIRSHYFSILVSLFLFLLMCYT